MLKELWGNVEISKLCKKINKNYGAIQVKAKRLGLSGPSVHSEYFSAGSLSKIMHVSPYIIINSWIKKHGLKAKLINITGKSKTWCIDLEDLRSWMKEHQELWNIEKIEPYSLGLEPEWLKNKRKNSSSN